MFAKRGPCAQPFVIPGETGQGGAVDVDVKVAK